MTILRLSQADQIPTADAGRPHALQLVGALDDSRPARRAVALASALAGTGPASLASSGGPAERQLRRAGVECLRLEATVRRRAFQSPAAQALIERLAADQVALVHVHGPEQGTLAKALAEAAGLPLVSTCHERPASGFLARRATLRQVTGRPVVAVSRHLGDLIGQALGLGADEIAVIPPIVDPEQFSESGVSVERTIALARAWGLVEEPRPVVLVPLEADTLPDPAVIAAAAARTGQDRALWVVAGGEAGSFEAFEGVHFVPAITDMAAALKLAAVVVAVPREAPDALDLALEAQAMGRPVVVTAAGAGPEAVDAGRSGWTVAAGDAAALAAAVETALALDASGRAHMAMAGRAFVARHHSPETVRRMTLGLYDAVLTRHR